MPHNNIQKYCPDDMKRFIVSEGALLFSVHTDSWGTFNNPIKMYVNAPSKIVPSHCVRVELPWEEIEGPKPLQKWLLMHFRFISGHSAWPGQASISIDSIWNSKSFFIIYLFIQIILYSCQSKNLTMANILNKKLYWISL